MIPVVVVALFTSPPPQPPEAPAQLPCSAEAVVGLAVGSFADRAIAQGASVGRLRKTLQTVPWADPASGNGWLLLML